MLRTSVSYRLQKFMITGLEILRKISALVLRGVFMTGQKKILIGNFWICRRVQILLFLGSHSVTVHVLYQEESHVVTGIIVTDI